MISDCRIIDLPKIDRRAGNITPVEGGGHIPFDIARVYYMYDIPGGQTRGGHAHKRLEQLIVAAMGSFDVVLDDGQERRTFHLDRAYYGLYVPRMMWRELVNFSSGSVCLVLASLLYNEDEYIRDYEDFRSARPAA
ncbi:MAG TPA: FdtA/QdtA family cupin domain-containing protein [Bryobacteraceae bacterium]|nr:FdtA/QdtA family cupin domain-containing protein [Bryobacteraceae bacterium]